MLDKFCSGISGFTHFNTPNPLVSMTHKWSRKANLLWFGIATWGIGRGR